MIPDNDLSDATFNKRQKARRAAAFAAEHDPLAMKMARGEEQDGAPITADILQAKAAAIRARFPYRE